MQNVPQYTALLLCTGGVQNKVIPEHIPLPVSASRSNDAALLNAHSWEDCMFTPSLQAARGRSIP